MVELLVAILLLALGVFIILKLPLPAEMNWARQIVIAVVVVFFFAWLLRAGASSHWFGLLH